MSRTRSLSYNAVLVLEAIHQDRVHGFDIMQFTGLASGTVYPILRRLESAGDVLSEWEDSDGAHKEGRPARRYYNTTDQGRKRLAEAKARLAHQQAAVFGRLQSDDSGS